MKKSIYLLALVLILSTTLLACSEKKSEVVPEEVEKTEEAEKSENGVLKIGVLIPLTGSEAYYGKDMQNSYTLAIDEINEKGGVLGYTLEIAPEDDACDASQAAIAASRIVSGNPDFVTGGYCGTATMAAMQQFHDAGLIFLISCSNTTNITDLNQKQSFMINSPGTHAVQTLGKLAKSLDVKRVATIHQGDEYTKNVSDITIRELPKDGFEIVAVEVMEKGAADVSAIVTAIRNSDAELIYWCGYHADGSNVIKQLRQGGYDGIIVCGDGSASPELIDATGEAGEGVYITSPPFVEFAEGGDEYIETYEKKFGMEPGTYSTLCYDTIYLLKSAIEKAGSIEYDAVLSALKNIEYKGLSGLIKFADNRELIESNFIILKIEEGKFVLVEP